MRTGAELIAATRAFASEDRWRSWWCLCSTLAALAGLLVGAWAGGHYLVRLPCSVAAGLALVRLFVIYHDYQHGTILSGSWPAGAALTAFGYLILSPPRVWGRSHSHHHKHNSRLFGTHVGSFPLMTTGAYAAAGRWERLGYAAARHPLTILLGYFTVFLYGMCLRPLLADPRRHWDSGVALALHACLAAGLAAFAPPGAFLLAFLLPGVLATAVGSYLFYAQHNFPGVKVLAGGDWDYVGAALGSAGYIEMGPVMRWFTGNIGYHHVHHLNPRIPFYRLPEAMAAIEELRSPGTTSLGPLDICRCLRLKLWDPGQGRMVGFGPT
jgi:omega-6 fatty acid desaturase (delta-12 desaturase)